MDLLPHFSGYSLFTSFLVTLTGILSFISYVPQGIRCLRLRDSSGVAPAGIATGAANFMLWNLYYVAENNLTLLWLSIASSVPYAFMMISTHIAGTRYWPASRFALIYGIFTALLFFIWPPLIGGVILCGSAYYFGNSLYVAYRAPTLTGLSVSTWILMLIYGLSYLSLGLTIAPLATLLYGLISTPVALSILVLIHYKSRKHLSLSEVIVELIEPTEPAHDLPKVSDS